MCIAEGKTLAAEKAQAQEFESQQNRSRDESFFHERHKLEGNIDRFNNKGIWHPKEKLNVDVILLGFSGFF